MKSIGILNAIRLCRKYDRMSPGERDALREERLRELVSHARENSPYFRRLYRDVPENFRICPPSTRRL